jgi:hypothetical protein
MKIKLFSLALLIVFAATGINAGAQKTYTQGVITYTTDVRGQPVDVKEYFTTDSTATIFIAGPATIKTLTDANYQFLALLVDVQVASIKKAAIFTDDEIKHVLDSMPTFAFTPGTETKQISGFNCSKVVVTNTKDNKTYDAWVTNDVGVPPAAIPVYYRSIGGFPVQYVLFQQGQMATVTVTNISETIPDGTFSIPPDFDRISKDELAAMSGGNQ